MLKSLNYQELCRMFKYYVTAGIGTVLDFGIFTAILTLSSLNYLVANLISFSVGTVVVYFLQIHWTFKCNNVRHAFVFTKYILVVILYYLFANLILISCVSVLHLDPIVSKLIQISLTSFIGYFINKKYIFNN